MGIREWTREHVVGVVVALVISGLVLGIPEFGLKLGVTAALASVEPAGPELAGLFANFAGLGPIPTDGASFVGEHTTALANLHPALPYVLAATIGLLTGEGVKRHRT